MKPVLWVRAIRRSDLLGPQPARALARLGRALAAHGPSLFAVVAWRAAEDGDRIALRDAELEFSYRQLERCAQALAQWLHDHQIHRSGPSIALWCQRPATMVLALLAAQRLGVNVVLLNTFMSRDEVERLAQREECTLVGDDPEMGGLQLPVLDPEGPDGAGGGLGQRTRPALARTRRVARISILSSGTTAVPQVVRRTCSLGALDTIADFVTALGVRRHDRARVLVPLFHGHGLGTVQLGLALGGTLTVRSAADQRADGYGSDWAAVAGTDLIVGVPTVLRRLLAAQPHPGTRLTDSAVRAVITGSAALDETTLLALTKALGSVVHNVYGTSETGVIAHAGPEQLRQDPQTVGTIVSGLECQIRDRAGEPRSLGEVGEVWVRGAMAGHPWRSTGDVGSLDARGWLRLRGRTDDTLVIGGELVVPEALEARIRALAGVADCAVRGIPDAEYGTRVELLVQLTPGTSLNHLRSELAHHLPRTLRPVAIIEVAELPRTATGKLQRHRLPASPIS